MRLQYVRRVPTFKAIIAGRARSKIERSPCCLMTRLVFLCPGKPMHDYYSVRASELSIGLVSTINSWLDVLVPGAGAAWPVPRVSIFLC